jgi:dTDP-4-amino-4,6-dideoxygalactose transaminase
MDEIADFASKFHLKVIEDASQAHGALFHDRKAGSFGDAGCFSLFPTKPLGAWGDAGIITSNDEELALTAKALRNHGRSRLNTHNVPGYTSRLDELQAAILLVKLKYLDKWNAQRQTLAELYNKCLSGCPDVVTPQCMSHAYHVYYLYVIRTKNRDKLQAKLAQEGIQTLIHYPTPIHKQPAYQTSNSLSLPQAEAASESILSLPMFAELTPQEVQFVCQTIKNFASDSN